MSIEMTNKAPIAPPEGVLDRLSVRLHSRRLDEALARGIPPETTPSLALRARRLTALSRRREIANGLCSKIKGAGGACSVLRNKEGERS